MQPYSVRDVERVLQLSAATIRALIRIGFVKPTRGSRREFRFSFQDLIVLRTARSLILAKVPRRRIHRALRDLRQHLPESAPLSGLCVRALGDRVVVREGQSHWNVGDGQYLLGFEVGVDARGGLHITADVPQLPLAPRSPAGRASDATAADNDPRLDAVGPGVQPRERPPRSMAAGGQIEAQPLEDVSSWFERGLQLEAPDPSGALEAYQRVLAHQPRHAGAWTNRGRLLHLLGRIDEAERVYRRGLESCGADALLWFNLGVLLEDLGRSGAALEAYQSAIGADPGFADGHYNLARLYEQLGKPQHAIRHLGQYRRLIAGEDRP